MQWMAWASLQPFCLILILMVQGPLWVGFALVYHAATHCVYNSTVGREYHYPCHIRLPTVVFFFFLWGGDILLLVDMRAACQCR